MRLIEFFERFVKGEDVFLHSTRFVADIMTENPVYLSQDCTVADAIRVFKKHNIRHVPIVEHDDADYANDKGPVLVGIVSHRDVSRVAPPTSQALVNMDETANPIMQTPLKKIMTKKTIDVSPSTLLPEAIQIMLSMEVDSLPVVRNGKKELTGIITTSDVIKCFQCLALLRKLRKGAVTKDTGNLPLHSFITSMTRQVMHPVNPVVTEDRTLEEVTRLISDSGTRRVFVVNPSTQHLVGVISDRDVLHHLPPNEEGLNGELFRLSDDAITRKALSEKASSLMTRNPVSVGPMVPVVEVIDLFCKHKFGAIPVIVSNRLVGVVTQTDLLSKFIDAYRTEEREGSLPVGDCVGS